jgi:hypothetical protein
MIQAQIYRVLGILKQALESLKHGLSQKLTLELLEEGDGDPEIVGQAPV